MPWIQAADITADDAEPEEAIKDELPEGYRAMCVVNSDESAIEFYDENDDVAGWEVFAEITAEDWGSEAASDFEKSVGEDWRVVFDFNYGSTGAWLIERYHDGE